MSQPEKPGKPADQRSHRSANPRKWTPRHWGDELKEKHARKKEEARAKGEPFAEPDPQGNERVPCRCGRRVPAFAMVDVRSLDASVRGEAEYACDACWTTWIRTAKLTRMEWLRGLGAPAELLEAHETRGKPHMP